MAPPSNNWRDNDAKSWIDNATDGGVDRRVSDVTSHDKLDSIITNGNLLAGVSWDYVKVTYPVNTTEVYTFKTGGAGGTTSATVTVVYLTSAKKDLDTVTRT